MTIRPRILICCNSTVRRDYIAGEGLQRLERLADWEWLASEGISTRADVWGGPSEDPVDAERLQSKLRDGFDVLIVCHGSPYIDSEILDVALRLKFIGELEGDRFANRMDVEAAAERGVRVVDTTHGSSLPVAEWALALMMIGLRNAGEQFRRLIQGDEFRRSSDDPGYRLDELTGRSVGLIGFGHIGRRLVELLQPFKCPDAVFVNVLRGAIVDPDAMIARASRGDIRVCLDVFDPEPIPSGSPIRQLRNVFLSPHIAGVTAACRPRFFSFMVDELERYFAGHDTLFDISPNTLANRRGLATPQ